MAIWELSFRSKDATRNKCIATSNKCLTSSNKKLLGALGLTTRSASGQMTHTDLKPENILLAANAPPRRSDFPREAAWQETMQSERCSLNQTVLRVCLVATCSYCCQEPLVASLLLVAMPGAPSSHLLLVVGRAKFDDPSRSLKCLSTPQARSHNWWARAGAFRNCALVLVPCTILDLVVTVRGGNKEILVFW